MFEGLKRRLERALDALEKKGPAPSEDDIDHLLAGMREELIDVRARVQGLEEEANGLDRRLERAPAGSEVAVRLGKKLEDTRAVLAEMRSEAAALTRRFKEAVTQRDALAARGRRTRAAEDLREGAGGAARSFDRAAERIEDEERLGRAERDLEDELEPPGADAARDWDRSVRERHADDLLEELKRRMNVENGETDDTGTDDTGAGTGEDGGDGPG